MIKRQIDIMKISIKRFIVNTVLSISACRQYCAQNVQILTVCRFLQNSFSHPKSNAVNFAFAINR